MASHSPALSHITLGTNDVSKAAQFYDAVLTTLGFSRVCKPEGKPPMYAKDGEMPYIYLYQPYDGRPATWGNGTHVAFLAESCTEVDAFYAAAMANAGIDEGAPGIRDNYAENYYAAYVRDPDGNKLQAVCYVEV